MVEEDKEYRIRRKIEGERGISEAKMAMWAKWQRQRACLEAQQLRDMKKVAALLASR
jgi:hypothetical protein